MTIFYDEALRPQAQFLNESYPKFRNELESKIGWKLRTRPVVVLVGADVEFARLGGSPGLAAFTLYPKGHVIIKLDPAAPQSALLGRTFRHELGHVLLHEHIRGLGLPHWLDEGICEWVVENDKKDPSGMFREYLTALDLHRHAVPLQQLSRDFPRGGKGTLLAYEESRSFVEYIVSHHGSEGLQRLLAHLEKGENIERAFSLGLSAPLDSAEARWRNELRHKVRWLIWGDESFREVATRLAFMQTLPATHARELCTALAGICILLLCWKVLRRKKPPP